MPLSITQEELQRQAGMDPVLEWLLQNGRPVTMENYLGLAYPEGVELTAEVTSEMPEVIQQLIASSSNPKTPIRIS